MAAEPRIDTAPRPLQPPRGAGTRGNPATRVALLIAEAELDRLWQHRDPLRPPLLLEDQRGAVAAHAACASGCADRGALRPAAIVQP